MYKNRIVIIVVLSIISFFIFRQCTPERVSVIESISSCILYPLLRTQHFIVTLTTYLIGRRTSIQKLEEKIEELEKKYEILVAENIALKVINQHREEIKELCDFNKRYLSNRGYVAQILARHFSSQNQFFLVDAGSSQGIKKDMVALYGNSIVGRVVCVYPWYSKVCLITDSDCKIAALCVPSFIKTSEEKLKGMKKNVSGMHEGINSVTHTILRYVSHLESVAIDDDVFSSGEGLIFPKGFALGKITAADKGDLFYTITVEPILDFQSLRYCVLIAKEDI